MEVRGRRDVKKRGEEEWGEGKRLLCERFKVWMT